MKLRLPYPALAFLTAAIACATPSEDVAAAAKKLGDAPNYAWTVTSEFANSQFPAMPMEGVTEKGGYTVVTVSFNGTTRQTVRKGEQVVMQNRDGDWMTMEELRQQFGGGAGGGGGQGGGGRGGFGMLGGGGQQDLAKNIATLAANLKDAKIVDGVIVGSLDREGVTAQMNAGRGGPRGGPMASPANASGSAKIWLKDGQIAKCIVNIKGTLTTPNGDTRDIDLTTTTEIKDVGATKVEVPADAKKKFGA